MAGGQMPGSVGRPVGIVAEVVERGGQRSMPVRLSSGRRAVAWRQILALILGVGLAVFYPALLNLAHPARMNVDAVLALAVAAYSAMRLAALVWAGQERPLEMVFWIYVYVFLGVAPALQVQTRAFPWPGLYTSAEITRGFLIVFVGILSYEIGYAAARSVRDQRVVSWELTLSGPRAVLLGCIALVASAAAIQLLGGPEVLFMPRIWFVTEVAGRVGLASFELLTSTMRALPFVAALALWHVLRESSAQATNWKRVGIRFIWAACVVTTFIVGNPIFTARYWFGTIVLGFVLYRTRWSRNFSGFAWAAGGVFLLTAVFPFADVFRASLDVEAFRVTSDQSLNVAIADNLAGNGDFASFQQVLNVQRLVDHGGTMPGRQFAGAVLFWVPRSIWPDKPIHTGELAARFMGYPFTNLEAPLWAEAYVNGGIVALVVVFVLYGFGSRRISDRWLAHRKALGGRISALSILYAIFVPYQIFFLRGNLLNAIAYLAPAILAVALVSKLTRRRKVATPA